MKKLLIAIALAAATLVSANAQTQDFDLVTINGPANYAIQLGDTMYDLTDETWKQLLAHPQNAELNTPDRKFTTAVGGEGIWLYPHRNDVLYVPEGFSITIRRPRQALPPNVAPAGVAFIPAIPGVTNADLNTWGWWILGLLLLLAALGALAAWLLRRDRNNRQAAQEDRLNNRLTQQEARLNERLTGIRTEQTAQAAQIAGINGHLNGLTQAINTAVTAMAEAMQRNANPDPAIVGVRVAVLELDRPMPRLGSGFVPVSGDVKDLVLVHKRGSGETFTFNVNHGTQMVPVPDGVEINGRAVALTEHAAGWERQEMERREAQRRPQPAVVAEPATV